MRITSFELDFNAKINSVSQRVRSREFGLGVSAAVKAGWGPVKLNVKTSMSYKSASSSTNKKESSYSMAIKVRAENMVELPEGARELLDALKQAILKDSAPAGP
eukprot:CAMPEP_0168510690 /NCGR_PEP_ID=MMETSP0405-20121227/1625_1 /TAXON_ID=498012 /ORGANISM="Trichosphaerium sp, Strain Am-I-7 wt" /LENGTH=103 /DNA_ID=CAMNT_0008528595 /DNA_START=52 /DNA_END=363 /DNA_ORIENTATION=+